MINSFIPRIRRRLLLEWDVLKWTWELRRLKSTEGNARGGGKTLLICDLMSMIGGIKVEALFAAAMVRCGYRVVVLLNRPEPIVEKIYRAALKKVTFIYFEHERAALRIERMEDAVDIVLNECNRDVSKILRYNKGGISIGKNALSLAIRKLRAGKLDLDNLEHMLAVRDALSYSLVAAETATKIISDINPDRALFNERGYTPSGEVFNSCLANFCDAIQWFGAPKSDQLMFKRYRVDNCEDHPMSLSGETWELIKNAPWSDNQTNEVLRYIRDNYAEDAWYNRQKLQVGKKRFSRAEVIKTLELDPSKKTAVIFAHILYDATFFYGESLFQDYQDWLVEAVRGAVSNSSLNWVVKVHPVNIWRSKMDGTQMEQLELTAIREHVGELPDHVRIVHADTSINTISLFEMMDYGLTVRGTVGMELPCLGVPVVTAGSGRYSGRGFTIDPASPEQFSEILSNLHTIPALSREVVELAVRHYFASLMMRPLPLESFTLEFDSRTYGLKDLMMDCFISPRLSETGKLGRDLEALVSWIDAETDLDLLQTRGSALDIAYQ